MLVSKKLRAGMLAALVNLVAAESPAMRMALTGKPPELFDVLLGIVFASDGLEVVADHLIETLAESFGLLAGASDELVFER